MKITVYTVLEAHDLETLVNSAQAMIMEGWQPYGDFKVMMEPRAGGVATGGKPLLVRVFYQAMVTDQPLDPDLHLAGSEPEPDRN